MENKNPTEPKLGGVPSHMVPCGTEECVLGASQETASGDSVILCVRGRRVNPRGTRETHLTIACGRSMVASGRTINNPHHDKGVPMQITIDHSINAAIRPIDVYDLSLTYVHNGAPYAPVAFVTRTYAQWSLDREDVLFIERDDYIPPAESASLDTYLRALDAYHRFACSLIERLRHGGVAPNVVANLLPQELYMSDYAGREDTFSGFPDSYDVTGRANEISPPSYDASLAIEKLVASARALVHQGLNLGIPLYALVAILPHEVYGEVVRHHDIDLPDEAESHEPETAV